jgi:hypothetical protein
MRWQFAYRPHTLPAIAALATFILIVIRAIRTVDPYWDTLAYHWPFAARLGGLCDRDCYAFTPGMEERYNGFPVLLHTVQGLLWRATGTPGVADLISIFMVVALAVYLKYRFTVPIAWSWLAFLAVPEVQIELTASYIDLPLNAAVTLALIVVLRILVQPDDDQRPDIAIALATLAIAVGSKYQLVPISLAVWLAIILLAARKPSIIGFQRSTTTVLTLGLAGALFLLPKLLVNTLNFHNPFYPIEVDFGPMHFPGVESMAFVNSISDAWVVWPRPVRWLASVLEFDAFRGRPLPWTLGQGDVVQSNPSFRMGGYFVPYVLGAVSLLAWGARSSARAKWPVALVIVLTLICALLPSSHELRYYMFWMLTLVSIVLVMGHSPIFASPQQAVFRNFTHGLIAVAIASVVMMTGAAYLRPKGKTLDELLRQTDPTIAQVPDGATLCILNRHPDTFLYSSAFHPPHRYSTKSLWADEEADCTIRLDLGNQRPAVWP